MKVVHNVGEFEERGETESCRAGEGKNGVVEQQLPNYY